MTPIKFILEIRNWSEGITTRPHWKNLSNIVIFPTCCRENQRPELKPFKPETDVAALGGIFLCGIPVEFFCNCSWTDALSIQMHSLYSFLQLKRSGRMSWYLNISYVWISAMIAQKPVVDKLFCFHAFCLTPFKKTSSIKNIYNQLTHLPANIS